ncbi:hypothetical protein CSKR_104668 [Clonorchis sinensis]|uniref:Uncharacterized protein n=1 Tax=Clonorchis sinensis TaxID=79923 RepID=A0A3R7C4P1_CLOSI|nr:hypothetical protein CSKR_104668 [Clonorchis sinensis]
MAPRHRNGVAVECLFERRKFGWPGTLFRTKFSWPTTSDPDCWPSTESMTPVFNTDASLSYTHDLFESLIVKRRKKWTGKGLSAIRIETDNKIATDIGWQPYLAASSTRRRGSRGPHPGRRETPTASKRFMISFILLCQVKGWLPLCLRHSTLGMENSTLFGKRRLGIRDTSQPTQLLVLDTFFSGSTRRTTEKPLSNCLFTGTSTPTHTSYGSETMIVEHLKTSQFHCWNRPSLTAIQKTARTVACYTRPLRFRDTPL